MSETRMPEDVAVGSETTPARPLSNNYNCRGRRTGFGDYVVCLEPPPHHCGYALHLGDEYLCLHPDHAAFADRTDAAQREASKLNP
jgi:hypothetical protein